MADPVRWAGRLSLRVRMVVLTALALTPVLLVAGWLFAVVLRAQLVEQAVEAAVRRAEDLARLADEGALPSPVPVSDDGEALVQVVGSDGVVWGASANIAGLPALDLPEPPPGPGEVTVAVTDRLPATAAGPFRIVAYGFTTGTGPATVLLAVDEHEIVDPVRTAEGLGLVGIPALVLLLSAGMWLMAGRTLAPVEAIRTEAAAITAARLDRRVPVPASLDEVGRLARTVNAMLARLQDAAERQRRFVADAAHELRSPIASLRAQLEAARGTRRPVDVSELTAGLLAETDRMQRLVEQLLLLARSDAGSLAVRRAPVDLDDLLDTVVARLPPAERARVDLTAVQPVQVVGDPVLLEQVVRNLLDNAVRHATGAVRVELSGAGGEATLAVDDDGPGIPPERRNEVFGRFTRLDEARDRDHGGAGLGLAIVAGVVRAHGGSVVAEDSRCGGARLRVVLPRPAG